MADTSKPGDKGGASQGAGPLPLASLTALGVVFGDLGTSPLYTLQTVLQATGAKADAATLLGILSLIFWTLIITVSVKYCLFVMRADNHGEGGILALMSLVGANRWGKGAYLGATAALLGAALIYGDGVITPSISVLSAVEGINVATSAFKPFVLPITLAILLALFAAQRFGTASIGKAFGPIMLLWFVVIAAVGLMQVVQRPQVLAAFNPAYAVGFMAHRGASVMIVLGAVFLCSTGGEALYADMGHVGRLPIRLSWYALVLPALFLSYAGQIALLLGHGVKGGTNPFFAVAPGWGLIPLVVLATLATIIASQAIITGSFSMTRQASQLGWLPLFNVKQTSKEAYGQIYIPMINWLMAAATLAITLTFRSSDKLAGAYGMAVSTTMLLTTFLLFRAMSKVWRWPLPVAMLATGIFFVVDAAFFSANLLKIVEGGYIPLLLGGAIFLVMVTWRQGIERVRHRLRADAEPISDFVAFLGRGELARTPGVAAFLTRVGDRTPPLISEYVRLTHSLHETVIALTLVMEELPRIPEAERASYSKITDNFWRVNLRYGFMENPDLGSGLSALECFSKEVDTASATFFGSRDYVSVEPGHGMMQWQASVFAFLYRNGVRITDRFNLPPDRTFEIAREIEI